MRSWNIQPPFLGQQNPVWPEVLEIIRVTNQVDLPYCYVGYLQQQDAPNLRLRDRTMVYAWDANQIGAPPWYYRGRLIGSHTGVFGTLPLYFLGLRCCAQPSSVPSLPSGVSSSSSLSSFLSSLSSSTSSSLSVFSPFSSSSSSEGFVTVFCCPNPIPTTLYITISNWSWLSQDPGCPTTIDGTYPLTWDPSSGTGIGALWGYGISGVDNLVITFTCAGGSLSTPCQGFELDIAISADPASNPACAIVPVNNWITCSCNPPDWFATATPQNNCNCGVQATIPSVSITP